MAATDTGEANGAFTTLKRTRQKKFMIFTLGPERFAIPLTQVKEVIGITRITAIPDMPAYFRGLINLRGKIISTIDLRGKLKIATTDGAPKRPCIIVSDLESIVLGAIVDDVAEVVGIEESQIERQLDIATSASREYITGVARFEAKPLTVLLDLAKVLDVDELANLRRSLADKTA